MTQEHRTTAYFFLSLLYATTEQLGWHNSASPSKGPDGNFDGQYNIGVHSESGDVIARFHTDEMLSDIDAEPTVGQSTRIWAARKLTDSGKVYGLPCTLRDYWIEPDRPHETNVYEDIRTQPTVPEERTFLSDVLVRVICQGDVFVDGQPDSTALMQRGALDPSRTRRYNIARPTGHEEPVPGQYFTVGEARALHRRPTVYRGPLIHRRVVYEGLLTPLSTVTNLAQYFHALLNTLDGEHIYRSKRCSN